MTGPTVTFIVPCYNLAHLLPECIDSILTQTYGDFEILIMDDCSPDDTPRVARSYRDSRVIHHRNPQNLRHLANFNKGIDLARGRYVWLISADDRLRSRQVLDTYVRTMENHPEVGYIFCPAMGLEDGQETVLQEYSSHGPDDAIFPGVGFLDRLLEVNGVVAASAMARKECYEKLGVFPLDMPYAGDWYLWCLFALHYDVAYCAEPMVNYRQHEEAITNHLKKQSMEILFKDDRAVLTRIREHAARKGERRIVTRCSERLIELYLNRILYADGGVAGESPRELEGFLNDRSLPRSEQKALTVRFYIRLADCRYAAGEVTEAKEFYLEALRRDPWCLDAWFKYVLLEFGKAGMSLRAATSSLRKGFNYKT